MRKALCVILSALFILPACSCGACAMVINGRPLLACDSKLNEVADKDGSIRVEPLRKFPVVRDLICDRTILWENLKAIKAWNEEGSDIRLKEDTMDSKILSVA